MDELEEACSNAGIIDCPYARTKMFMLMFHTMLTKRLEIEGLKNVVKTYAVCPTVCETNLKRYFPFKKYEGIIPIPSADAVSKKYIIHFLCLVKINK